MSLFSVIQNSANALQVAELGLQVVGNNVANAGTPGYIRQELIQTSGPAVRTGPVILTYGVRAVGVAQKLDEFVAERLRQVRSDLASSDRQVQLYSQLESIIGEMNSNDLSSQMNDFSASIQNLLNHPGNEAIRRLVVEQGKMLAGEIQSLSRQLTGFNTNLNSETRQLENEINRLTNQIASLNRRIVELEGGKSTKTSDAVGLRDERQRALDDLSAYVNIRVVEQDSGAVSVFVGGEYLVTDGIQRPVTTASRTEADLTYPEIRLADTDFPLEVSGGQLHGIYQARRLAIQGIGATLDQFARDVIEQFNHIHSQGQGTEGFSEVTSHHPATSFHQPLNAAGYWGSLRNGEFQVQVLNLELGTSTTHNIRVQLTGAADDTSLSDIRDQLQAISGINASLTSDGRLQLSASSHKIRFTFQNDSSNFLSAAGINTFFVGHSAATIAVNSVVAENPRMFAASLGSAGYGTDNAIRLAQAFEDPMAAWGAIAEGVL